MSLMAHYPLSCAGEVSSVKFLLDFSNMFTLLVEYRGLKIRVLQNRIPLTWHILG